MIEGREIIDAAEYNAVFNELLKSSKDGRLPDGHDCFGYFIQKGFTLYYRERPYGWRKSIDDPMKFLFYKRNV